MIIRAKTLKQWVKSNLSDYIYDIYTHGCDAGFPGITYYRDTMKLYNKFSDEIWELACNEADEMGASNVYEFLAGFNPDYMPTDFTTHANQMVWFAVETYARELQHDY